MTGLLDSSFCTRSVTARIDPPESQAAGARPRARGSSGPLGYPLAPLRHLNCSPPTTDGRIRARSTRCASASNNHLNWQLVMDHTPEIEAILNDLTDLCVDASSGDSTLNNARIDALVAALAMNGWERKSGDSAPLSVVLRKRIDQLAPTTSKHAEMLEGILTQVQKAYDHEVRFRTSVPETDRPAADRNDNQASPPLTTLNVKDRL